MNAELLEKKLGKKGTHEELYLEAKGKVLGDVEEAAKAAKKAEKEAAKAAKK